MSGHVSSPKMRMIDHDLALAEEARRDEDDEQERDGEEDVDEAHQDVVDLATPEAGDGARRSRR